MVFFNDLNAWMTTLRRWFRRAQLHRPYNLKMSHNMVTLYGVYESPRFLRWPPTSPSDTETVTEARCASPLVLGEIIDE